MMCMKQKKKRCFAEYLLSAGIAAGLMLLLLPVVWQIRSDLRNEEAISKMVSRYDIEEGKKEELKEMHRQAQVYNAFLSGETVNGQEEILPYEQQLCAKDDVMGYLEIPRISVKLLIYHGADENALMAGAGHVPESSLPVGGVSAHCVITAHSGMKNMKAFDEIGQLEQGNLVVLHTAGVDHVYQVRSKEIVLPDQTDSLKIRKGEDLLTLVTCTPYGINSHRLLVHCERTDAPPVTDVKKVGGQQKETSAVLLWKVIKSNLLKPGPRVLALWSAILILSILFVVRKLQKRKVS